MTSIRVGVLGAGGQVGPWILRRLAQEPRIEAVGICRNVLTAGPLRMAGFEIRCGAVGDPAAAESLLGDCAVVVNCAAASNVSTLQARAEDDAVARSLAGLSGSRRVIHLSSVGVYGTSLDSRRNTFERPRPDWTYGREKLRLENVLLRGFRTGPHGLTILRMGHVYGAGQWVSKWILEIQGAPGRRLPFDGRLPSNAVHVANVASAVRTLALDEARPGIFNLLDSPTSSWREVFDWNTGSIGAPPVPAMSDEESRRWADHHHRSAARSLRSRIAREAWTWMRGQPAAFLKSVPSARTLAVSVLEHLRLERLQRRGQMTMQRVKVGKPLAEPPAPAPESWLLSDGAPGPKASYPGERAENDARELADWHRRYSRPEAIWDWPG